MLFDFGLQSNNKNQINTKTTYASKPYRILNTNIVVFVNCGSLTRIEQNYFQVFHISHFTHCDLKFSFFKCSFKFFRKMRLSLLSRLVYFQTCNKTRSFFKIYRIGHFHKLNLLRKPLKMSCKRLLILCLEIIIQELTKILLKIAYKTSIVGLRIIKV